MGTFVEMYEKLGEDGSEVLSIHMTGGMSGTVATANSLCINDRYKSNSC